MVLTNLLCALNLGASMMVNGACCYYQMDELSRRRKEEEAAIENAIRVEADAFRKKERIRHRMEQLEEYHRVYNDAIAARAKADRRRELMNLKASFMSPIAVSGRTNNSPNRYSRDPPNECNRAVEENQQLVWEEARQPMPSPTSSFESSTMARPEIPIPLLSEDTARKLHLILPKRRTILEDDRSNSRRDSSPKFSSNRTLPPHKNEKVASLFDHTLSDDALSEDGTNDKLEEIVFE